MATERNAGISGHISSFSQGAIVQRSRLGDDRKTVNSFSRSIVIAVILAMLAGISISI